MLLLRTKRVRAMLTLRQRKTYDFIQKFFDENDHAPTAAEIAEGIGIKSRGVVHRYLKALDSAGLIRLLPKRHRNIQLMESSSIPLNSSLPLVGAIAAGQPIEAIEQDETVDVASVFLGPNRYALKVKGDSMIDEGIFDGDIVVCERSDIARDGQIVVALIDRDQATLKRLYHNADKTITLLPSNPAHKPMIYSENQVEIQGIYIGLLRIRN